MPTRSVVKTDVSLHPAEPADRLAALRQELDETNQRIRKFDPFDQRVAETASALERAEGALREFRAAEEAALRRWAENGVSEPHARDGEVYARLVTECDAAARDRDEAEAAMRAVEPGKLSLIVAGNGSETRSPSRSRRRSQRGARAGADSRHRSRGVQLTPGAHPGRAGGVDREIRGVAQGRPARARWGHAPSGAWA